MVYKIQVGTHADMYVRIFAHSRRSALAKTRELIGKDWPEATLRILPRPVARRDGRAAVSCAAHGRGHRVLPRPGLAHGLLDGVRRRHAARRERARHRAYLPPHLEQRMNSKERRRATWGARAA